MKQKQLKNSKTLWINILLWLSVFVTLILAIVAIVKTENKNCNCSNENSSDISKEINNWVNQNREVLQDKVLNDVKSITFYNDTVINAKDNNIEIHVENTNDNMQINFIGKTGRVELPLNQDNNDIVRFANNSGNDKNTCYWYYNYNNDYGTICNPSS